MGVSESFKFEGFVPWSTEDFAMVRRHIGVLGDSHWRHLQNQIRKYSWYFGRGGAVSEFYSW